MTLLAPLIGCGARLLSPDRRSLPRRAVGPDCESLAQKTAEPPDLRRDHQVSRVPGLPLHACHALGLRRSDRAPTITPGRVAFRSADGVGLLDLIISELYHAAHVLPVYASRLRSPSARNTRFRSVVGLTGRGFHP